MKRPILYIAIPLCAGIFLAQFFKIPVVYPIILSAAFITIALIKSHKNILSHLALYFAIFFFGIAVYQNSILLPTDHISKYVQEVPEKVFVQGVIIDDPVTVETVYRKEKTTFTLRTQGLWKRGQTQSTGNRGVGSDPFLSDPFFPTRGLTMVNLYSDKKPSLEFGDEVILQGTLSKITGLKNPGTFDYPKYLAIRDIYSVLKVRDFDVVKKLGAGSKLHIKSWAYKLRRFIREACDKHLEGTNASFMKAILIGDRIGLPDDIKDSFVKTGTVHIIAISGLNVGMIAAVIMFFLAMARIPRKADLVFVSLFMIVYCFTAGASPPIVRAVIIFIIITAGYLIDRTSDMLNSLSLAAVLILLYNPKELFDPSFQLSFASVAGIIIFTPRLENILGANKARAGLFFGKFYSYCLKGVSVSAAACLVIWPIVAAYFNIVSVISVAANLIVVPILFILTAAAFPFIAASLLPGPSATIVAAGISIVEQFLFTVNGYLARAPMAYFRTAAPSGEFLVLYYAFLAAVLLPKYIFFRRTRIYRKHLLLALLVAFNILAWKGVVFPENKNLRMTFLDVGSGDASVIELPEDGAILIDGGSGGGEGKFDIGKNVIAPFLWNRNIRSIDAVILSHFHEDHLGGLIYILNNFKVGCVIDNGASVQNSRVYDDYIRTIKRLRIKHLVAGEGDTIGPFGETRIYVLNPGKEGGFSDSNDNSLVLKIVNKNFSALFCGDVMSGAMARMLSDGENLKSDVIKVPHHGGGLGDKMIVEKFFSDVEPRIAVISSGSENGKIVSTNSVSDIITSLNSICYVTKQDGAVSIEVDPVSGKIAHFRANN
ncbi:MAG: DNA internalization-related competence protein ComEC/Rec2 [Candidatus Omnitrophota bacterium]|nr:DNA internalization-related competence protein ComEC/Rec2 [Candidatus Omnitrophota bacterium]